MPDIAKQWKWSGILSCAVGSQDQELLHDMVGGQTHSNPTDAPSRGQRPAFLSEAHEDEIRAGWLRCLVVRGAVPSGRPVKKMG